MSFTDELAVIIERYSNDVAENLCNSLEMGFTNNVRQVLVLEYEGKEYELCFSLKENKGGDVL